MYKDIQDLVGNCKVVNSFLVHESQVSGN